MPMYAADLLMVASVGVQQKILTVTSVFRGGGIKGDGPPQTILQKKDKKRAKINVT